ncbi:MAG: phasin family protein [Beijerinckiaceae bacterium]
MSTSKTAAAPGVLPEMPKNAEEIARNVQGGVATAMELPKKMMECNLDTSAEFLTFISRRMKAQAELLSGVVHCHDVGEAADMQRKFMEKVSSDYAEEMNHLADIARKNFQTMSSLMSPQAANGR